MTFVRLVSFLLLFAFLHACAVQDPVQLYSGPKRPAEETVHLRVPGPITVVKLDGKEVDVPSLENDYYNIYLLPGLHRIDFKYVLFWGDNTSGMVVASDVVAVETRMSAGKTYTLTYHEPATEEEAYEMSQAFKATLVEQGTGRKVASRTPEELNIQGITTTLITQPMGTSASQPAGQSANTTGITPPGIDAGTAAHEDAVKRLKFWWLIANQDERKEFKQWLQTLEAAAKQTTKPAAATPETTLPQTDGTQN